MELLLSRPVVVGLALLGALLSTGAFVLEARGYIAARTGRAMNMAGYGLMAASMLLFVFAGLLGAAP